MAETANTERACVQGHTVYVYDRGGRRRINQIKDLQSVQWERDRDGVSEATIKLTGSACDEQRDVIDGIISKRHELVVFRGQDRVWEGPIFRVSDEGASVTVAAKDVGAYLFGTALSRKWDNRATGDGPTNVTTRFENIIAWELTHSRQGRKLNGDTVTIPGWEQLDPPINVLEHLEVHHWPNEARTAALTDPFEMTVGEHLAGAARSSGIDWTAVGRSIHIWDTSRSLGRTRTLTEKDFFGYVIVTEYGADHTQIAYVVGQDGVYGEAVNPDNLDLYGPWTTVYTAYNEEGTDAPTQVELTSQAARNTSGRSPVPWEVRIPDNSSIRLNETLTINDLIPGVQVPLRATLNSRRRDQMQKLDHVRVTETADGETIQVTMSPATRADSDDEETP